MSDVGPIFSALADPTRRTMIETMLETGSTSVPALSAAFPISRQAVAKHLTVLAEAGLIERARAGNGRDVRYSLRAGALRDAAAWMRATDDVWNDRLKQLKRAVETGSGARSSQRRLRKP